MTDVSEVSALMEQGNWDLAEQTCVDAIKSGVPYRFQVVMDYTAIARKLNHQNEAIQLLEGQSKKYPQIAGFYDELGKLYWSLNDRKKAISLAETAVRKDYETAAYYNNLGNYHRFSQNFEKAAFCYQKVIKLIPENSQGYVNVGRILVDLNRIQEALTYFRKSIEIAADDHERQAIIYASAVKSLIDKDFGGEAYDFLEGAPEHLADQPYFHQAKAKCLVHLNRLAEADEVLKTAIDLDPKNVEILNDQGLLLRKVGRLKEAEKAFKQVLDVDALDYEAWLNLGNLYKAQDLDVQATDAFRKAYEICPHEISAICSYARHKMFVKNDPDIAKIRHFLAQEGITDKRQNHLKIALAKALNDVGEYREAFELCREANQYMKQFEDFSIEDHRQRVMSLSQTFREKRTPLLTATEPLPKLLLVTGMSRSGKTLVEKILRQSPDVVALGEDRMWFEEMLRLSRQSRGGKPHTEAMKTVPKHKMEEITRNYLNRLVDIHGPAKLYVNTLPSSFMFIGMMFPSFPEFKVIDCRREPLDQVIETYFKHYEEGNGYSTDLSWAGEYWFHYRSLMEQWHQLFGEKMMTVQYEKLVSNQDPFTDQIFEFAGIDVPNDMSEVRLNASRVGMWKNYEPELKHVIAAFENIQKTKSA